MYSMSRVLLLFLLVAAVACCHYSCAACTGPEYISCINCTANGTFSVVLDTSKTPNIYWSSAYSTGTCVPTFPEATNTLGIVVFIFVSIVAMFFRTKQTFYLMFTLQTYGLYNLLELAWVNPIGYILQGLQHFMIFNTIGLNYKTENYVLVTSKNHRLDSFLGTTNVGQNLAIIAPFTLIGLAILILIAVITLRKKKQAKNLQKRQNELNQAQIQNSKQPQNQVNENRQPKPEEKQWCKCWRTFSEQVLIKIAKFVLAILFLLVQQTMVVLLVNLVYQSPVSRTIIVLCVIYLHILPFVMSYSFYYRIEYFSQKKIMYLTFAQKIILPVMVVVPIKYQYVFFIFAVLFVILEYIFDRMNGLYQSLNRLAIYKVCEAVCVLVLTVYYIVQLSAKSYPSSQAASIAATFFIAVNIFLFFAVQLPISIKEKYFNKKGEELSFEEKDMGELLPNDTFNTINQKDEKDHDNIFQDQQNNGYFDQYQGKNKREHLSNAENNIVVQELKKQPIVVQAPKKQTVVEKKFVSDQKDKKEPLVDESAINGFKNIQIYAISVDSFPASTNDQNSNFKIKNIPAQIEKKQPQPQPDNEQKNQLQNIEIVRKKAEKPVEEQKRPQPQANPLPKKKRRQIIDPQLRLRYGI